jgi:ribonuclease E
MPNKMLIDATHPEETRVVVVRGNRVEEFDFESAQRKQLRGNIYLAKVTRVEPSLQAAFIEYGGNRHGFLAFSEIHPDYYQIPVADRQALIEADERAHREAEEETENRSNRRRSRHRGARRRGQGERVRSEVVEGVALDPAHSPQPFQGESHGEQVHGEQDHGEQGHDHPHDHAEPHFSGGHDHDGHPDDHSHDHDHGDEHDHAHADGSHAHVTDENGVPLPAHEAVTHQTGAAATYDETPNVFPTFSEPEHDDHHADAIRDDHDDESHDSDHAEAHEDDDHGHHDGDHSVSGPQADDAGDEDDDEDDDEPTEEETVESVGGDDALEEVPERIFRPRRQYKIQEVIKRRQVMLVQVVKEERGNKGAALTTYLSLAGRYAVLMPNTARGGGISRKITSAQDRSRLKEVVQDLDVPEGMGIILRTAGASRTKPEIKRDFEYLIRMWETVRDLTLKSQAPNLVYEEGSLIKRSLRDLYNKEIEEIQVSGEAGYNEARDFMKMLMPTHTRAVRLYRDGQPLFSRMGVESQLDAMFSPTVQLRSGGYIVINQTEALVSIDVNSGRSTREHHIEDTALKTNLEAAEEVARQLRLRDLAGLIVIDFIDMDEKRNNRSVERKLSECLKHDRARIQVGRISHFGLLEMSRQRIRAGVLESSTEPCPHCGGTGHVRSVASVALQLLRGLEEVLMKGATHNLVVRTRTEVALYVLNHKRGHLRDLENSFKVTLAVIADPTVSSQQSFVIDRGEQVHTLEAAKALLQAQAAANPPALDEPFEEDELLDADVDGEADDVEELAEGQPAEEASEGDASRKRKRRRRRRGRSGEARDPAAPLDEHESSGIAAAEGDTLDAAEGDDGEVSEVEASEDDAEERDGSDRPDQGGDRRPRRRGRRGGRRRRNGQEGHDEGSVAAIADDLSPPSMPEAADAVADLAAPAQEQPVVHVRWQDDVAAEPSEPQHASQPVAVNAEIVEDRSSDDADKPRRRSTIREKVSFFTEAPAEAETSTAAQELPSPVPEPQPEPEPTASTDTAQPRRAGWWSRRFGNGE